MILVKIVLYSQKVTYRDVHFQQCFVFNQFKINEFKEQSSC